jgi:hypothetical protein
MQAKGFVTADGSPDPKQAGGLGLIMALASINYIDGLVEAIENDGFADAELPLKRRLADGTEVYQTLPREGKKGNRTEVYVQPGRQPSRGGKYRAFHAKAADGACAVLGGGNRAFLGVYDTLHKMFEENMPVVLKHHDTQARPWSPRRLPVLRFRIAYARESQSHLHLPGRSVPASAQPACTRAIPCATARCRLHHRLRAGRTSSAMLTRVQAVRRRMWRRTSSTCCSPSATSTAMWGSTATCRARRPC